MTCTWLCSASWKTLTKTHQVWPETLILIAFKKPAKILFLLRLNLSTVGFFYIYNLCMWCNGTAGKHYLGSRIYVVEQLGTWDMKRPVIIFTKLWLNTVFYVQLHHITIEQRQFPAAFVHVSIFEKYRRES